MRLEMFCELGDLPAQESNLYFWRTRVRLVGLILGKNLPFRFYRQCHSRAYSSLSSLYLVLIRLIGYHNPVTSRAC